MVNLDFQQQKKNNWTHENIQKVKSVILPPPPLKNNITSFSFQEIALHARAN